MLRATSPPAAPSPSTTPIRASPPSCRTPAIAGTFGTFTLDDAGNWTYTADNSQAAIQQLGATDHITDSFTAVSSDGTATQLVTVTINGTNDVPVIGGVSTGAVTEDVAVVAGNLATSGALTINDADQGQSNFVPHASIAGTTRHLHLDDAGNWTYTADDSQTAIHRPGAPARPPPIASPLLPSDGSNSQLVTVTINGTNDAPVLNANGGSLSYTENQAATAIDALIIASDVDSANLTGATVSITTNFASGQDVLGFTTQNGITGSYVAATGILTLSGSSSVANYQAALGSVTYSNTSDNPSGTTRTISYQVDDGSASNHASNIVTSTVAVTPVNDAPVATITPTSYAVNAQTSLTLQGTGLSISDVDAASGSMTVTLSVVEGTLNVAAGTTGALVTNSGTSSVTITGTVTQINNLLAGSLSGTASYIDNSGTPSPSTVLTLLVHDNGNTGTGGDLSSSDTATINITVHSAPVLNAAGGSLSYTENQAATAIDTLITASDVGTANLTGATVSITTNFASGQDVLGFTNQNGITGSYAAATGILTLSGSSSVANYQAALRSVTYSDTSDNPSGLTRTISYQVDDGSASNHASNIVTSTVAVTPVNDAPVLNAAGGSLSYTENHAATAIDTLLTASDVDSANLTGATVSITTNFASGEDVLGFTNQNGITGSYVAATGILTLSGSSSVANYQAALRSVTYSDTSDNPSGLTRTISYQVDDGSASNHASNIVTSTVAVTPVNDPPTFAATAGTLTIVSNAGTFGGVTFTEAALAAYFTDPDSPAVGINTFTAGSGVSVASTGIGAANVNTVGTLTITDDFTLGGTVSVTATDGLAPSTPTTTVTYSNHSTSTTTLNAAATGDSIIINDRTTAATLTGGAGNDTLIAGSGGDDMTGGSGIDTFIVNSGGAQIEDLGTGGADILIVGAGVTDVEVNVTAAYTATAANSNAGSLVNITTTDFAVDLSLAGGPNGYRVSNFGPNGTSITGSAFNDTLLGGTGSDTLIGGAGNDTIYGASNDTLLDGGSGTDTLVVNAASFISSSDAQVVNIENVTVGISAGVTINLSNQTEGFTITGNSGADTIIGGSGNDTIIGGPGADTLTGGPGSDTFNFAAGDSVLTIGGSGTSGTISGYDVITDYVAATTAAASEKLGFTGAAIVANGITNGTNSSLLLHTGFAVGSHSITDGIITFGDISGGSTSSFSSAISLTSLADVAAVAQYLQANDIGTAGSSVAFTATISGVAHTFVYIQGATNTSTTNELVDLLNVSATSMSTSGLTNQLAVIYDTTPPTVSSEAITGATGIQNSTLNAGDVVSVTVTMSKTVTVTGTPQLALNIGGTTVQANYASGSGGSALVFTYTILAGQTDTDGISMDANALSLNSGAIKDGLGNDAVLTAIAVTDNAGFKVDTTAPLAPSTPDLLAASDSGSSSTDNITNDTTPTFSGTAEAGSTVKLLDGATQVGSVVADSGGNWTITSTTLGQAVHSITATATDPAGNVSIASGALSVTIDTTATAPSTPDLATASDSGSSSTDNITNVTTPTFTGTGVNGDTVTIFDGATAVGSAIVSGGTYTITTSALSDGVHSITAKETDAAGNTGTSAALSVTIDTTAAAPVISGFTTDSGTVGDHITNDTTLTINGTAEIGATVTVFRDGVSIGTAVANGSGNWSVADATTLTNATTYQYSAQQTDVAGNTSAVSGNYAATIDTAAPGAPSTPDLLATSDSGSSNTDNITNDTTPTFTGTAEIGATVKLFDGATQVGSAVADGSGNWTITSSTLSQAVHSITATATDVAGNVSIASGALSVTIDTTAPTVSVPDLNTASDSGTSGTDNNTNVTSPTFTVTLNGTVAVGDTVQLLLAGASLAHPVIHVITAGDISTGSVALTVTAGDLGADGSKSISATISDLAGNSSTTSSLTITLDTTAPSAPAAPGTPDLLATSDSGSSNTDNITNVTTPTFTGTGVTGDTVTIFDGATAVGSAIVSSGTYTITTSALAEGVHSITAKQTVADTAGNVSTFSTASGTLSVTIDTTAPAAPAAPGTPDLLTASDSGSSNTDNITNVTTPTFTGTGVIGDTVTIFDGATAVGSAIVGGGGTYSITTSTLSNGVHSITAQQTVADTAGNVSAFSIASSALSVTIDNTAPLAPSTPDLLAASDSGSSSTDNITNVTTPTFTGTAEIGDTVKLFDGATQVGSAVADGSGNWTITSSTLSQAVHSITATATDVAGNTGIASGALSVTIDTTAPTGGTPDLITASDSGTSSTDNITNVTSPTFTVTLNGTAAVGDTVQLLLAGASLAHPVIHVITAGDISTGSVALTVTAGDLGADGSKSISATFSDLAGNSSTTSSLTITLDTTAPAAPAAPGTPDLLAASDSGSSNTDNITNVTTPTFTGTGVSGDTVTIFDGATAVGSAIVSGGGTYTITTSALAEGVHNITAQQSVTDTAGNVGTSSLSGALPVTIDTTAPAAPSTPDLLAASDSGSSSTDNITKVTTPTFTGTGTTGDTVTIFDGATAVGSATVSGGTYTITTSALSDGVHSITAKDTDTAGNTGTSAALSVTIDTTPPAAPTFTLDSVAADVSTLTASSRLNIAGKIGTFTAIGDVGDTYTLSGNNAASFSLNSSTGLLSVGGSNIAASAGLEKLTVTATDPAGNATAQNFQVYVGASANDTLNLASVSTISTSTPTVVYDFVGTDSITTGAMTGDVWVVAGSGGSNPTGLTVTGTGMTGALTVLLQSAWNANSLTGGSGTHDTLVLAGSSGTDNLTTGTFTGFENIALSGNTNTLTLGNVNVTVNVTGTGNTVTLGAGTDTVLGGSGNTVTLGNGADTVSFTAGTNIVNATSTTLGATTTITGGSGTDTLNLSTSFTSSSDAQITGFENVTLTAAATLNLSNQTEGFTITGSAGNDTITGGSGNDTITGGAGADTMTGGAGADTFVINSGNTSITIAGSGNTGTISGYDIITDFATATDFLNLQVTPVAAANTSDVNGNNSTLTAHLAGGGTDNVSHHSISNGIITFFGTGSATLALSTTSDVAACVQYLEANDLGNAGTTVAFTVTISGTAHTYIYEQVGTSPSATNDILVDLSGVTVANLTTLISGGHVLPAGVAGSPVNLGLTMPAAGGNTPITVTLSNVPSGWTIDEVARRNRPTVPGQYRATTSNHSLLQRQRTLSARHC